MKKSALFLFLLLSMSCAYAHSQSPPVDRIPVKDILASNSIARVKGVLRPAVENRCRENIRSQGVSRDGLIRIKIFAGANQGVYPVAGANTPHAL